MRKTCKAIVAGGLPGTQKHQPFREYIPHNIFITLSYIYSRLCLAHCMGLQSNAAKVQMSDQSLDFKLDDYNEEDICPWISLASRRSGIYNIRARFDCQHNWNPLARSSNIVVYSEIASRGKGDGSALMFLSVGLVLKLYFVLSVTAMCTVLTILTRFALPYSVHFSE